jgi:Phage tail protein
VLTRLEAYSSWESAPTLPLSDNGREETDLIQIRNIDGIDPVKAAVNTSPFGSVDGVAYTGSSVASRNIVITLHPNPDWNDWTFESLRRLVYSYFMPKQLTRLVFTSNDIPPVEIYGYVESCEVNPFASDVEILVSIICPDPYFTAVTATLITGDTSDGTNPLDIQYNGSIEAGINVEVLRASDPAPTYIAIQVGEAVITYFRVAGSVDATKYFLMNSVPGAKYVRNVAWNTGVITNLLSKLQTGSQWPTLKPGSNDFSVITDTPGHQQWQLRYFERRGGL